MAGILQTIPPYALSAICLLSSISRFTFASTDPTLSPLSILSNFQTFPSAVSIDGTQSYMSSVLVPALMDLTLAAMILSRRTRFWACGTVLVLLGMSVGTNAKRTEAGGSEIEGESGGGLGVPTSAPAPVGRFEINMFKLMVANLATLSAWRDAGVGKWLLAGSPQAAPVGAGAGVGSGSRPTAKTAGRGNGESTSVPAKSVHERLR